MNKIKKWILYYIVARLGYKYWKQYRMQDVDEYKNGEI